MNMGSTLKENPLAKAHARGKHSRVTSKPLATAANAQIDTNDVDENELIRLSIDDIVPFDNNPREGANPRYEQIKESIKVDGLLHPPNVTKRNPDDDKWMIADGGNTRLEALIELRKEANTAGDKELAAKFSYVWCRKRAWTSDIRVLAYHVTENDVRGSMSFIEKARAYAKIMTLAEGPDWDSKGYDQIQKMEIVKASGWNIRQDMISRFDRVLPFSNLLPSYLTRTATKKYPVVTRDEFPWVTSLLKAYEKLPETIGVARVTERPKGQLTDAFKRIIATHDDPELNQAKQRAALAIDLNTEFSKLLNVDLESIQAAISLSTDPSSAKDEPAPNSEESKDVTSNKNSLAEKKNKKPPTASELKSDFTAVFSKVAQSIGASFTEHHGIPFVDKPSELIDAESKKAQALGFIALYVLPTVILSNSRNKSPLTFDINECFKSGFSTAWISTEQYRASIKSGAIDGVGKQILSNVTKLERIAVALCSLNQSSKGGNKQ